MKEESWFIKIPGVSYSHKPDIAYYNPQALKQMKLKEKRSESMDQRKVLQAALLETDEIQTDNPDNLICALGLKPETEDTAFQLKQIADDIDDKIAEIKNRYPKYFINPERTGIAWAVTDIDRVERVSEVKNEEGFVSQFVGHVPEADMENAQHLRKVNWDVAKKQIIKTYPRFFHDREVDHYFMVQQNGHIKHTTSAKNIINNTSRSLDRLLQDPWVREISSSEGKEIFGLVDVDRGVPEGYASVEIEFDTHGNPMVKSVVQGPVPEENEDEFSFPRYPKYFMIIGRFDLYYKIQGKTAKAKRIDQNREMQTAITEKMLTEDPQIVEVSRNYAVNSVLGASLKL